MRQRFVIVTVSILAVGIGYYVASPLLAAYQLRLAIKTGDEKTVAAMVNWPTLRSNIRRHITRNAKLLPIAEFKARQASRSWWQRIRSAFGHSLLDRFIERYITPEGLTELYRTKANWHDRTATLRPQNRTVNTTQAGILPPQWRKTWHRVQSAVFVSPFLFEIEVADRHKPNRFIKGQFRLTGLGPGGLNWQLTGLSVRTAKTKSSNLARLNGF